MENRILKVAVLVAILFLCTSPLLAANHYILDGGTGDGSAWNNALDALPATLVRGDTYYIGDGTYGYYVVDDAVSGTDLITIKKATATDHGTETGWEESMGDGQAIFSVADPGLSGIFDINTSYVVFDGQVGSGSDSSTYGFKFAAPTTCNKSTVSLGFPGVGHTALNLSNITISHVAILACGHDYNYTQNNMYSYPASASAITVSNCYFEDANTNLLFVNWSDSEISGNYFNKNWENTGNSGQQISPDNTSGITLKNNIFKDSTSFIVGEHSNVGTNTGWKVFNNLIIGYQGAALSGGFGSAISGYNREPIMYDTWVAAEVHHNTFVDIDFGSYGAIFADILSDVATGHSHAYNNLFYNCANPVMSNTPTTSGAIVHDYNAYLACTGTITAEDNNQTDAAASDPFTDSAGGDYTINSTTDAANAAHVINTGKALAETYNTDKAGTVRAQGAGWDIGAYEYIGATTYTITNNGATGCTNSPASTSFSVGTVEQTMTTTDAYGYDCTLSGCGGTFSAGTLTYTATGNCTIATTATAHRGVLGGSGTVTLGGSGTATLGN